ncbi:NADH-quinone oxidoreductase subunit J [Singulisphaera sp. GP187]|uniref:NADH-quinone oxidoreductase subunit J family protein n=1 Tax=Singulisphaera sp. GP187 TaxID=1882752 RepID=UPI00092B08FF|nr:NADH-quinone oxidoreductase subunit J [Singulisphaera sp. GP187]SIO62141.1 NADH-quinone oxidoreductase subunit J [Singulisphaera sp. GP187]
MNTQANDLTLAAVVVVLGAVGTYLLLPHKFGTTKPRRMQAVGGGLTALALLLFALFWTPPGPFLSGVFFYLFSFTALAGALLTITSRNPIYSALWFAAVVLSTSGLFLLEGAQFLAAGTVIVYAGAIIVTFLFVIMLAQMEGRALYDRSARSPFRATLTCFLLFWALLYSLFTVRPPSVSPEGIKNGAEPRLVRTGDLALANPKVGAVLDRASRSTSQLRDKDGLVKPHVAGLGETLYTDNLVTVELAGALLFVALIAALSIAPPKPPIRPGDRQVATTANL